MQCGSRLRYASFKMAPESRSARVKKVIQDRHDAKARIRQLYAAALPPVVDNFVTEVLQRREYLTLADYIFNVLVQNVHTGLLSDVALLPVEAVLAQAGEMKVSEFQKLVAASSADESDADILAGPPGAIPLRLAPGRRGGSSLLELPSVEPDDRLGPSLVVWRSAHEGSATRLAKTSIVYELQGERCWAMEDENGWFALPKHMVSDDIGSSMRNGVVVYTDSEFRWLADSVDPVTIDFNSAHLLVSTEASAKEKELVINTQHLQARRKLNATRVAANGSNADDKEVIQHEASVESEFHSYPAERHVESTDLDHYSTSPALHTPPQSVGAKAQERRSFQINRIWTVVHTWCRASSCTHYGPRGLFVMYSMLDDLPGALRRADFDLFVDLCWRRCDVETIATPSIRGEIRFPPVIAAPPCSVDEDYVFFRYDEGTFIPMNHDAFHWFFERFCARSAAGGKEGAAATPTCHINKSGPIVDVFFASGEPTKMMSPQAYLLAMQCIQVLWHTVTSSGSGGDDVGTGTSTQLLTPILIADAALTLANLYPQAEMSLTVIAEAMVVANQINWRPLREMIQYLLRDLVVTGHFSDLLGDFAPTFVWRGEGAVDLDNDDVGRSRHDEEKP